MKHDIVTLLDWYQARYQAIPLSWISSSHLLIPSFPLESNKQKHIKKHIEWAKKQRKGQITPKENDNTKKIFANINQAIDLYLIRKYKLDLTFCIPVCVKQTRKDRCEIYNYHKRRTFQILRRVIYYIRHFSNWSTSSIDHYKGNSGVQITDKWLWWHIS